MGEIVTTPEDEPGHVYHLFVSRSSERDRIVEALREADIGCATYYLPPLHLQPALELPRLRGGLAAGDREARARELLRAALGRDRRLSSSSASSRSFAPPSARAGRMTLPISRHRILNLLADAVLIVVAWRLTFWIRFDQSIPSFYKHLLDWQVCLLVVAIQSSVFVLFGFYNRWWRYVSTRDMWGAARGVVVACLLVDLVLYAFPPAHTARLPRGVALINLLLLLAFVAGSRLLARSLIERPAPGGSMARGREVVIVGAGDAGQLILRELQRSPQLGYTPIGLARRRPAQEEPANPRRPRARPDVRAPPRAARRRAGRGVDRDALRLGRAAPADRRHRAGGARAGEDAARPQRADLRRRQPRRPASSRAGRGRPGTRAGRGRPRRGGRLPRAQDGARHGRGRLDRRRAVPADRARRRGTHRPRRPLGARAVRYRARTGRRARLSRRRCRCSPTSATGRRCGRCSRSSVPDVVFHAAAYKHVPLLEANPLEAVRNNVLATKTLADVAVEFETKRFVLVSTDKAAQAEEPARAVEGILRVDRRRRTARATTSRRASSPCGSATCSARPAA